jgi:hypothetical protein
MWEISVIKSAVCAHAYFFWRNRLYMACLMEKGQGWIVSLNLEGGFANDRSPLFKRTGATQAALKLSNGKIVLFRFNEEGFKEAVTQADVVMLRYLPVIPIVGVRCSDGRAWPQQWRWKPYRNSK